MDMLAFQGMRGGTRVRHRDASVLWPMTTSSGLIVPGTCRHWPRQTEPATCSFLGNCSLQLLAAQPIDLATRLLCRVASHENRSVFTYAYERDTHVATR